MTYHLVVTREFGAYKIGSIITGDDVAPVLAGPQHRNVVQVFPELTHVGRQPDVEEPTAPIAELAAGPALPPVRAPEPAAATPTSDPVAPTADKRPRA